MNAAERLLGEAAVARHGNRVALYCGSESVTYAALALLVRRAAGALAALDVGPGDRVLLLMRDTPALAAAWLGCLWRGAVAVALNDRLSDDDYRHIVADSNARLAVAETALLAANPILSQVLAAAGRLLTAGVAPVDGRTSWDAALAAASPAFPAQPCALQDPAFWLYSSGTTGRPKGIVHMHMNVIPAGEVLRGIVRLGPGDKVIATSRLFFAYGLEHALVGTLALGAASVLNPDWSDVRVAPRLAAQHTPTAFFSVPSFYRRLLALDASELEPLRRVPFFFAAGERLPPATVEEWRGAIGREILSIYGLSETFCVAMVTPPGTSTGAHTGKPLRGVEARLLTEEGCEAEVGEPGVLWLRHPALARGYANRADLDREHFRDGWFCTKDVFARDAQGCYQHQGRADDLIKVAGQWVRPSELEEVVLGDVQIAEAVSVPVPDEHGFERLALFVTPRGDSAQAIEAARAACEAKLPKHKRPKWIRAVADVPRTATGKVQRYRLREQLERELKNGGG